MAIIENEVVGIDPKYWNPESSKCDTHTALEKVGQEHYSHWSVDEKPACDLMVVECRDGRFYIEDGWGGGASGYVDAFDVYEKSASPVMMSKEGFKIQKFRQYSIELGLVAPYQQDGPVVPCTTSTPQ